MLTSEAVRAPYPGLRPFEADEADLFFGRERHVDALLKRLSGSHFVAVVGESGAGKSSLVRAGLLPALQAGFVVEAGSDWRVAVMRPGGAPLEALAEALLEPGVLTDAGGSPRQEFALAELRRGPLGLVQVVRDAYLGSYCNLLIVVDQFEEVFRYCREPAQKDQADIFVELILRAADQREVPIFVVLTMRSDFVGDCARFRGLPETLNDNQYLTPRLTREQIAAAIREPARVCGGVVDPALVDELCNAVGDNPDQLPLLQHLMMRVWDRASEHAAPPRLTSDIAVKLGGLHSALNHHAQNVYDALRDDQKATARAMFKRLTDPLSQRRDLRRDAVVCDIAAVAGVDTGAVIAVADAFRATGQHMLMPPPAIPLDADSRLDISHESLIRQWVTLDGWAREENVSAREFLRLRDEAQGELEGQADLLTGRDLTRALDWMRQAEPTAAWAARYSAPGELETTAAFINRSAAEAQRRKDDQARLLTREAAAKRQRIYTWLSAGALVLAIIVTGVIFTLWRQAQMESERATTESDRAKAQTIEAQKQEAEAKRQGVLAAELAVKAAVEKTEAEQASREAHVRLLTANARTQTQNDPALALLLAGAAVDGRKDDEQAAEALRGALAAYVPYIESTFTVAKSRHYVPKTNKTAWLDFSLNEASLSSREPLAVAPSGDNAIIWSLASPQSKAVLSGHEGIVGGARFSPDGTLVATSSQDRTARVWDVSGKLVAVLQGHAGMLNDVIFSPDGKLLITMGDDQLAQVWSVRNYSKPVCKLTTTGSGNFLTATFSHDRQRLLTVIHDGRKWDAEVWNISDGNCPAKLDVKPFESTQLKWASFSPYGPWLGIVRVDGGATIFDTTLTDGNGQWPVKGKIPAPPTTSREDGDGSSFGDEGGYPPPPAWSADGQYFAAAGTDDVIRVAAIDGRSEVTQLRGHTARVTSLSFHPTANVLLSTSVDGSARLWKLGVDMRPVEVLVLRGHQDKVGSGVFALHGNTILTAADGGKVRMWQPRWTLVEKGLTGAASVGFTSDGRRVWVAGTTRTGSRTQPVDAWTAEFESDTLTGNNQSRFGSWSSSTQVAGPYLLARSDSRELKVQNVRGNGSAVSLANSDELSSAGRMRSSNGRFLLRSETGAVRVWDLDAPAKPPQTIEAQRVDPNRLDAERRKTRRDCNVAAISNDKRIAWYCAEEDRMRVTVGAQPGSVQIRLPENVIPTRTEFSSSGRVIAINFEDRSVRIFDSRTGRLTLTIRGHSEPLVRLAFSADDRLLLGIGEGRSHIWTLPKGEHIAVLPPAIAGEAIKAAAFSPDSRWLAFVSSARLLLWRCEACGGTDAWLGQVDRRQVARMLSREQLQGYSLDAEGRANLREHDHDHRDAAPPAPQPASTTGSKPH